MEVKKTIESTYTKVQHAACLVPIALGVLNMSACSSPLEPGLDKTIPIPDKGLELVDPLAAEIMQKGQKPLISDDNTIKLDSNPTSTSEPTPGPTFTSKVRKGEGVLQALERTNLPTAYNGSQNLWVAINNGKQITIYALWELTTGIKNPIVHPGNAVCIGETQEQATNACLLR